MVANSVIPDPSKAFDRYAYTSNNPVKYNDPSGHFGVVGGVMGGAIGGMVGAIGYFSMNYRNFDEGQYWVAVGAGATAGALIGSGLAIAAEPQTAATVALAGSAMVGSGSAMAVSEVSYMVSNRNKFKTVPFVETTAIDGAVGGISAVCPASRLGVVAKGLTYIGGAEGQYALQTDHWTIEGAQEAALFGTLGAYIDVGTNMKINEHFLTNGYLQENVWQGRNLSGYSVASPILREAALQRGRTATANVFGDFVSGSIASVTTYGANTERNKFHFGN